MYVPSTKPVAARFVSVFAAVIAALLKLLSAALVISDSVDTVTLSLTKYAVPASLLFTTAFAVF